MAAEIHINTDKVCDTKQIFLNNGDLVVLEVGKKNVYYLVSSYVKPEESARTASKCVLIQLLTGHKIGNYPVERTTSKKKLLSYVNRSFAHGKHPIKEKHVTIVARDSYNLSIELEA